MGNNRITDIGPVAQLENLTRLLMGSNTIRNIDPVAGLSKLFRLYLFGNQIADISALAGLPLLDDLQLENNLITNIAPLSTNQSLRKGSVVLISGNPIDASQNAAHFNDLLDRGIAVQF